MKGKIITQVNSPTKHDDATVQIQQKATAKEQLGAWLGADCVG